MKTDTIVQDKKVKYASLIGNQHAKGSGPNKTSFKRGNIPWNKDLKGIHVSPKTEFKKGRKSLTKMPVGTITKRKCKGNTKRHFIKIANPQLWEKYAKYLWKKHYGFILSGDVIHHLNGNTLDDRIENLIALPRSAHPVFHGWWGLKQMTGEQINFYNGRYLPGRKAVVATEQLVQLSLF